MERNHSHEINQTRKQEPARIQALDSNVSSFLRASLNLPDLSTILSQLAFNSLDSGSSSIHINLDLQTWSITCIDDGRGFSKAILDFLAQPTTNSKLSVKDEDSFIRTSTTSNNSLKYGQKGETLTSLASLGLLEIKTTPSAAFCSSKSSKKVFSTEWTLLRKGNSKSLYYGPTLANSDRIFTSSNPFDFKKGSASSTSSSMNKRTTITIRDLFHSLPVRRSSLSTASSCKVEIEKCRKALSLVAFREPRVKFVLSVRDSFIGDGKERVVLNFGKTRSIISRFTDGFGESILPSSIHELSGLLPLLPSNVSSSKGKASINAGPHLVLGGFISLLPSPSRSHQHVYLCGKLVPSNTALPDFICEQGLEEALDKVLKSKGIANPSDSSRSTTIVELEPMKRTGWGKRQFFNSDGADLNEKSLHEAINDVFSKSLFASGSSTRAGGTGTRASSSKYLHPLYVLDLKFNLGRGSFTQQRGETVLPQRQITNFLKEKISEALSEHGLLSQPLSQPLPSGFVSGRLESVTQMASSLELASPKAQDQQGTMFSQARDEPSPVKKRKGSRMSLRERVEQEALLAASRAQSSRTVELEEEEEADRELLGTKEHLASGTLPLDEGAGGVKRRDETPEEMDRWIDPTSRRSYFVDHRTGTSYDSNRSRARIRNQEIQFLSNASPSSTLTPLPSHSMRNTLRRTQAETLNVRSSPPSWLSSALSDWKNPIFDSTRDDSRSIPQLGESLRRNLQSHLPEAECSSEGTSSSDEEQAVEIPTSSQGKKGKVKQAQSAETKRRSKQALPAVQSESRFFGFGAPTDGINPTAFSHSNLQVEDRPITLRAEDLKTARVIAQVDRKFIACVLSVERGSRRKQDSDEENDEEIWDDDAIDPRENVLVFLDQHATDERIRLERFLRQFILSCLRGTPESHSLAPPKRLKLSQSDISLMRSEKGIGQEMAWYGLQTGILEMDDGELSMEVSSVPEVIKERLTQSRESEKSLKELVISFIADWRDRDGRQSGRRQALLEEDEWLPLLRHLPPRLLDLINSKACRGAIMFNDLLTLEESSLLLRRLSRTFFPFNCAHGRPSLTPICSLGFESLGERGNEKKGGRAVDWGKLVDL